VSALSWIEFDPPAYFERAKSEYGSQVQIIRARKDSDPGPARAGWLLQQHPADETAFKATECRSAETIRINEVEICPTSVVWSSGETPLPWPNMYKKDDQIDCVCCTKIKGYHSSQMGLAYTYNATLTNFVFDRLREANGDGDIEWMPYISICDLWVFLTTINDLPIGIAHVQPSKGYMARGSYKKFFTHSVICLNVPQTRWRKLACKAVAMAHRRAHQVRGHFRIDWRKPLDKLCEHEFDAAMICRHCRGHKIWIHGHTRGDASLGFVARDFEVHHNISDAKRAGSHAPALNPPSGK
jgi:hypothetical protein